MPLPNVPTCDISDEVCCESTFTVAEALLDDAYAALSAACLPEGCGTLSKFVSVGEPSYTDEGEYLAVWLMQLGTAPGGRGGVHVMPRPRAQFGFKLIEKGYPTLEAGAVISAPDSERIHAIARHSYSHGEKVLRYIYDRFRERTLPDKRFVTFQSMGTLVPLARTSGQVGWKFDITLDIEWTAFGPMPEP